MRPRSREEHYSGMQRDGSFPVNGKLSSQYGTSRNKPDAEDTSRQQMRTLLSFGPALALITRAVLDKERVLVSLVPRLVSSLGWRTPWTDRVHVALGLASTTTVWMVSCGALA